VFTLVSLLSANKQKERESDLCALLGSHHPRPAKKW
jgi:hypothetical protein